MLGNYSKRTQTFSIIKTKHSEILTQTRSRVIIKNVLFLFDFSQTRNTPTNFNKNSKYIISPKTAALLHAERQDANKQFFFSNDFTTAPRNTPFLPAGNLYIL
jgi:hypothetical protein